MIEKLGGRTRARTWDPMIKSSRAPVLGIASEVQPTLNQRYAATEREQTLPIVTKFINVFTIFRVALPAHNGRVAGRALSESTTKSNVFGLRTLPPQMRGPSNI